MPTVEDLTTSYSFYPYQTLDKHIEHLAQMQAREIYNLGDWFPDEDTPNVFIEGYGSQRDFGIKCREVPHSMETEIQ